jgi:hypothetical protein
MKVRVNVYIVTRSLRKQVLHESHFFGIRKQCCDYTNALRTKELLSFTFLHVQPEQNLIGPTLILMCGTKADDQNSRFLISDFSKFSKKSAEMSGCSS